ncbi:hypothetical protein V6N12_000344 [Hibiscus sabdariffa]|uniref:Flowering-promoting factor 1-like protein 3 n=1 Tax=Hibiscus sabdariffa TaxID=183260 RepID=A0ABR2B3N0_9ROSI
MSGVWVFKNGVVRLVENPGTESLDGSRQGSNTRRKVLVHTPSNEIITSYAILEHKLWSLGWERYYDDPDLFQFHKRSTVHLISLPKDFNKFKSIHIGVDPDPVSVSDMEPGCHASRQGGILNFGSETSV